MANNIDIKFSGQVELRAAKYLYTGVNGNDCFRAILTNFYNSAYSYSNALIAGINVTNPENAFDRDETNSFAFFINEVRGFNTSTHRFRPHRISILATGGDGSTPNSSVKLKGFDENTAEFLIDLGTMSLNPSTGPITEYVFDNLHKEYPELRRGWCDEIEFVASANGLRVYQLYVYGEVINKQEEKLPPTFGATTIEEFSDSFISVDPNSEGSIIKDGSLQLNPRRAHSIKRLTLTTTFDIPSSSEVNIYNIDPNGSNRIVNLPRSPQFNHYIRINNLDGGFQIRVNDSDHSTLIQNLSTADGPNTLEAIWANNQWIITS